ncbi:MAG: hypothetical protein GY714_20045 [Desulfobacterales bacterium]|nr:hypothetical protein [Desulfobacterales bacterium]
MKSNIKDKLDNLGNLLIVLQEQSLITENERADYEDIFDDIIIFIGKMNGE